MKIILVIDALKDYESLFTTIHLDYLAVQHHETLLNSIIHHFNKIAVNPLALAMGI